MSTTISQMIILIIITCIGFVSAKVGYIDADMRAKLTKILVSVTLPCMIVVSANDLDASAVRVQIPIVFALAIAQFVLLLACGAICNLVLKTPKDQKSLYLFMAICTNTAFIGLPLISSLYSGEMVLYASIFVMVLAFFMYSVGLGILAGHQAKEAPDGQKAGAWRRGWNRVRRLPWKSIANPSTLSCVLAIIMLIAGIRIPTVLASAMDSLGSVTSPIALMLVGSIIADADIKSMVKEPRMYAVIAIRQLIVPLGLLFALDAIGIDRSLIVVFTVMFAMPIGSLASPFAEQFGRDAFLAAKGTVLSTIASFAIIPLLVAAISLL